MNALTRSLALCLALAGVVTLSACDSSDGDGLTATGTVENTFGNPIEGATVEFVANDLVPDGTSSALGGGISCTTEADGDFSCDGLSIGSYDVVVSASGYATQNFTVEIDGDEDINVPDLVGAASINAPLVNALTGLPVASAPMHCHRGLANGEFSTNAEFETTSSAAGQVVINNVFSGEAQCFVDVSGPDLVANFVIATTHTSPITGVEPPAAGAFRVVLTWGANPSDLDSHLTGPDGSGDRFHVYYANPTFAGHNLDVDDVTSFGPETITIAPDGVNGMYRYSVHNFSDQTTSGSVGIAQSPTTVRVYNSSGLIRTFVAPGASDGNTWRVFEMTVSGNSVTFSPSSSQNGLGYFQASGAGDTTVFLTGPGGQPAGEKR